jgi:hypothetical protein
MKPKGKSRPVHPQKPSTLFAVWAEEGGEPQFPDGATPPLPPEENQYVLVSVDERMSFDRLVRRDGNLCLENHISKGVSDPSILILGVVVSGIEWFALPEEE